MTIKESQFPAMSTLTGAELFTGLQGGINSNGSAQQINTLVKANLYGTDTGAANAYVVTPAAPGAEPALYKGLIIFFTPSHTNTGGSTVNWNGTGAVTVLGQTGNGLIGGELSSAGSVILIYNGASWQILATVGVQPSQQITAAETTAGCTIVQYQYPPGYVDRYGINTTPGTTDMTAAFQAAINQSFQVGGSEVTYNGSVKYLLTAALNCTVSGPQNSPGLKIRQLGGGLDTSNGILAKHNQVAVFDCTGCDWVCLEDVTITTDNTTFPSTGFFHARNSGGYSVFHRLTRVKIVGHFGVANYYNYGTEGNVLDGCYFENNNPAAGTKTTVVTGNNTKWGLTSPYTAIKTGAVSTTVQDYYGCYNFNNASTSTTDCIYVEGTCNAIHSYGGYAYTTAGRALVYFDMATGPSNYVVIDGLKGDVGAQDTLYGVLFSNDVATPIGFSIRNCAFPNYTYAIGCTGANPTLNGFYIENINEQPVSHGISIPGTLVSSYISCNETNLVIGTSKYNTLVGDSSRWTITTRTNDYWIDQGPTNKTIATVTSTGITSSSGPLVARARLSLSGPCLSFNIVLASTSGNLAISAGATLTLTAPGGQSLALSDIGSCTVVDETAGTINGAAVTASGSNALITIPVAVASTSHTVVVSGTVFLA